jgi:hypothetical protein
VGVVELDGHLVGQVVPVGVAAFAETPDDVVKGAADEEVFLQEAQPPAHAA